MTGSPPVCAYCGAPAIHKDHVVPASLQRKYHQTTGRKLTLHLAATVPSCGSCNWLKSTRRLVPPSWESKVAELAEVFPGVPWRVWNGDTQHEAFKAVHRG